MADFRVLIVDDNTSYLETMSGYFSAQERIEAVDTAADGREALDKLIRQNAIAYAICRIEPQVIDEINILEATRLCMKNAVESLAVSPGFVLTDGNMTLDISIPQRSLIKGDSLCYSIGAASIIAKVYRDKIMDEYALTYPQYGFEKNKGYGTAAHIAAIKEAGICPIHRRSFTKKWI